MHQEHVSYSTFIPIITRGLSLKSNRNVPRCYPGIRRVAEDRFSILSRYSMELQRRVKHILCQVSQYYRLVHPLRNLPDVKPESIRMVEFSRRRAFGTSGITRRRDGHCPAELTEFSRFIGRWRYGLNPFEVKANDRLSRNHYCNSVR